MALDCLRGTAAKNNKRVLLLALVPRAAPRQGDEESVPWRESPTRRFFAQVFIASTSTGTRGSQRPYLRGRDPRLACITAEVHEGLETRRRAEPCTSLHQAPAIRGCRATPTARLRQPR